jgi:hypothetical protein
VHTYFFLDTPTVLPRQPVVLVCWHNDSAIPLIEVKVTMIFFLPSILVLRKGLMCWNRFLLGITSDQAGKSGFPCINVESGIALSNVQYYASNYCSNLGIHLQICPSINTESYVCLVVLPLPLVSKYIYAP